MFDPDVWRFGRMMNPWREMQRLQRDMNRLFSSTGPAASLDFPLVNIWMSENNLIITAEVPGMDTDKIDISVVRDHITISGTRDIAASKEGENYHRQERNHGRFTRTLQLPFHVEAGKVDAKYERGVLTITLPRAEADKPKKILIKTE